MQDSEADRLIRDIEELFEQLGRAAGDAEARDIGLKLNNAIGKLEQVLGGKHPRVTQLRERQKRERKVRHGIVPPAAPETEPLPPPDAPLPAREPDVPAPHNEPPPHRSRPSPKLLAVLGGVVFVFSLLVFCGMQLLARNIIASNPTPTVMVRLTSTLPVIPSATPTITPTPVPIVVEKIDPVRLTGATQPWHVTLTGSNLSAAQTLALRPADRDKATITLTPLTQGDTQITLNLDELYHNVQGQVTYTLVINNKTTDKTIVVQDFLRSAQVQGIDAVYRNRDPRLFFDESGQFGAYLWANAGLQTKVSASPRPGSVVVSWDDTVEILEEATGTHRWPVVRVRVRSNRLDGDAVIGKTGWISQWLVDGRAIPPAPTPVPTSTPAPLDFRVQILEQDGRQKCVGGPNQSIINGTVFDRFGNLIPGATVQVLSLDGYQQHNVVFEDGHYKAANLPCGWWRVQVTAVGGRSVTSEVGDVHVTGEKDTGALIDFWQR